MPEPRSAPASGRIRSDEQAIQPAREEVSVQARQWTSASCSDQGALQLKHQRPNEHSVMSAKPATQTAGPTLATHRVDPKVQGRTVLAAANLAPGGHPQAARAADQITVAQPILLRLPMVMRTTGLARSTIYKLISQNQFPVPIKLSTRAVAWLQSEIESWVSSRVRAH
jgi:prophage regulatory protein